MTRPKPISLAVRRMRWLANSISQTDATHTPHFLQLCAEWAKYLREWARDLDKTDARETKPDPRLRKKRK